MMVKDLLFSVCAVFSTNLCSMSGTTMSMLMYKYVCLYVCTRLSQAHWSL